MKGNPLGVLCLFAVWAAAVGGSVLVAARIDEWLAEDVLSAESSSLRDALAGTAAKDAAAQLSRENPALRADPVPDHPGQFRLTNAKSGATAVVDLDGLHRLLVPGDEVAKLFPSAPAATNGPGVPNPAAPASGSAFSPGVTPLPPWIPAPPGGKLTSHYSGSPDGQGGGAFLLAVSRPWSDVVRFYEGKLQGGGYAVSRNEVVGGAMPGVIVTAALDGPEASRRTLQLTVTQDGRGAQVAGTYGGGPGGGSGSGAAP